MTGGLPRDLVLERIDRARSTIPARRSPLTGPRLRRPQNSGPTGFR